MSGRCFVWIVAAVVGAARPAAAESKPMLYNDRLYIFESTFAPGFRTARHSHPANEATYVIAGGRMKYTLPGGRTRAVDLKTGELRWRTSAETHTAENIGNTEVRLLTIRSRKPGDLRPSGDSGRRNPKRSAIRARETVAANRPRKSRETTTAAVGISVPGI